MNKNKKKQKYTVEKYPGNYFYFANFWDNEIELNDRCKESYLESVDFEDLKKLPVTFSCDSWSNTNLNVLHGFEKEFGFPLTRIEERGENYTVVFVNPRWRKNLVVFGLFLELLRASHKVGVKTWREISNFDCRNVAKIKMLWSENFEKLIDNLDNSELSHYNCVHFLDEFNAQDHQETFGGLKLMLENLPLINFALNFEKK